MTPFWRHPNPIWRGNRADAVSAGHLGSLRFQFKLIVPRKVLKQSAFPRARMTPRMRAQTPRSVFQRGSGADACSLGAKCRNAWTCSRGATVPRSRGDTICAPINEVFQVNPRIPLQPIKGGNAQRPSNSRDAKRRPQIRSATPSDDRQRLGYRIPSRAYYTAPESLQSSVRTVKGHQDALSWGTGAALRQAPPVKPPP